MRVAPPALVGMTAAVLATAVLATAGRAQGSRAETSQAAPQDLAARLRAVLDHERGALGFPGACATVVRGERVVAVAVGEVVAEPGAAAPRALRVDDRLLSGSIGKSYVAATILHLVSDGVLELDEPIASYVGEEGWFEGLPNAATLTLRILMRHQSGIREHVWMPAFHRALEADPDRVWRPAELLDYVRGTEPLFAAGEGWSYADTNFVVAGLVAEAVTGRAFFDLVRERVLEPLELADTVPSDRRDVPGLTPGLASGAAFHEGPTHADGRYFVNPQFEYCGGGLASTTRDLARFCWALFAGDALSAEQRSLLLDAAPTHTRLCEAYGLGVMVSRTPHGRSLGHSGFMPGYNSRMAYYEDLGLAVALQINDDDPRRVGRHLGRILDALAAAAAE